MQKLFFVLLLYSLLLSCSDRERVLMQMTQVDSLYQHYESLADDSIMPFVVSWMDNRGSCNERMKAHYLQAAVYRDRGQTPEALEELHVALESADTISNNCDFGLLGRIHGMMAELFYDQYLLIESLNELEKVRKYAFEAQDTLNFIWSYEFRSYVYDYLEQNDSAFYYIKKAIDMYHRAGYDTKAINCYGSLVLYLIEKGQAHEAKDYLDIFSEKTDSPLPVQAEMLTFINGKYKLLIEDYDQAKHQFEECLKEASGDGMKEAAYLGLSELYDRLHRPDSVAKYAKLCYQTSKIQYEESHVEQLRNIHLLYNYNHHKQTALTKEQEAERAMNELFIVIMLSCTTLFLLIVYLCFQRREKFQKIHYLETEIIRQVELRERVKLEMAQMKDEQYSHLLKQKEKEVCDRQKEIDRLNLLINTEISFEDRLVIHPICARFHDKAAHPLKKVTKLDWYDLHCMMNEMLPDFRTFLNHGKVVSNDDYNLCILLRLNFTIVEISSLNNKDVAYYYTRCKRLLKKWYEREGKPDEFIREVKNISRKVVVP